MESHRTLDQSLPRLWAQKYVSNLTHYLDADQSARLAEHQQVGEKILKKLRFASSQAWSRTEALLMAEIKRHRINEDLIDPWQIAVDSRQLFEKMTTSYLANMTPARFSIFIAPDCGKLRHNYAIEDPRILGFMSMQFHFTGQILLEELPVVEQKTVANYLKVIDDHLYMPLQRSYEAAGNQALESPTLKAVQQLLPLSTQIAEVVCADVAKRNSGHKCYSGFLNSDVVRISSIRDVEMFQIYLCLCVLETNIAAVQQELFPLCVMLYPPLNVHWQLVRQMLNALEEEIKQRLTSAAYQVFSPYIQALQDMFSLDVFPENDPIWSHHPDVVRYMNMARNIIQDILQNPPASNNSFGN
jgi:hypothetical protein